MMSDARTLILDALATVTGVTGHPSIPNAPTVGDAWPVWESSAFTNGKLTNPIAHTYSVWVLLTSSYEADTVAAADRLVEELMTALHKIGTVDTAEPVTIPVDPTSTMPAVRVRVTPRPN